MIFKQIFDTKSSTYTYIIASIAATLPNNGVFNINNIRYVPLEDNFPRGTIFAHFEEGPGTVREPVIQPDGTTEIIIHNSKKNIGFDISGHFDLC